ncbi:zinc finger and SCAN domain-containing protein 2 isoform X1 [Phyllopteryx taeniolatus]|uniref:zinc finger and SCAN domain-containing protein 2 isoform X1 n=2 Tax=Phyllopteryx taeniolatus TaxID=161469 RepID=UPI002AD1F5D8|nr:zinc finger and SCAN domain-containing protein 2 isoform X1 [Phyllopteryx taeniolatus]XP_061625947.1 zinc finger and SCAN domain-containing protein 2 isoform X1 [Phyllopteryx taeniolatus]
MSDLETLTVTFQAQLLDVMETVMKTAMYKVTQLVEEGFLEEVKRRNQELETLRMKLECAEMKLSDHGLIERKKDGTFVDIASDGDGSTSEERLGESHVDLFMSCGEKKESDSTERWTGSQICEIEAEADEAPAILNPENDTRTIEHADGMPSVDVKEEVNEEGCDSHGVSVMIEAHPGDSQETAKGDVLLRKETEKDLQISNVYNFPDGLGTSDKTTDLSVGMDTGWAGLTLHHQRVGSDWESDPAKNNCSLQQAKNELGDFVTEDGRSHVNTSRDQLSTCKIPDSLSVPIKQEVFMDSGGGGDMKNVRKMASTTSGITSFSCAVKKNPNSHKTEMQEGMKLHSNHAECDKLQAPMKRFSRPLKKPPPTPLNSTPASSRTHSQTLNLNTLNRIPSSSKTTPPTALVVQRDHFANKLTTTLWVTNSSQTPSTNSQHAYLLSHPDCPPVFSHSLRCGQCGKCFPHPNNLKAHLQTHTGERPFCCSLCGRSFTKLSNLKAHRRVHTGERPYCCLACGKRFTQKCNLKRHQRIHVDG